MNNLSFSRFRQDFLGLPLIRGYTQMTFIPVVLSGTILALFWRDLFVNSKPTPEEPAKKKGFTIRVEEDG